MGCLLEVLFQLFIEGIIELVMSIYLKFVTSIAPEKAKSTAKNIITTISVLLVLVLFIGIIFLLPDDPVFNTIGKYMTFIPLSIIAIQLIIGIFFTVIKNKSK